MMPYTTYDTIHEEFIYAGKFDAKESQLEESPLVNDDEIVNLDIINHSLKIKKSGAKKIYDLKVNMRYGHQFVITINKKPIFTGYFWDNLSSYVSAWNCIEYTHNRKINSELTSDFYLYKTNGMKKFRRTNVDYNDFPNLTDAFKETNRLNK